MITTTVPNHRPPPVSYTVESVIQGFRSIAAHGPEYVRRGARAALNRILGPGWRLRPSPKPADARLTPEQRKQFHLHPVPILPSPAGDLLLLEQQDTPEEADDPL